MGTRAPVQEEKDKLIAGLVQERRRIIDAAAALSPAQREEVFLGAWSVKELLAHLIGWDLTNIAATKSILGGELPEFYNEYDPEWRTYNARLVAEHIREDFPALLQAAVDSHRQLIDMLQGVPAEEFDRDRGLRFRGYEITLARLLDVELKDEKEHLAQILMAFGGEE